MRAALMEVGCTVVSQTADVKGSDSSIFITKVVLFIAEMNRHSKTNVLLSLIISSKLTSAFLDNRQYAPEETGDLLLLEDLRRPPGCGPGQPPLGVPA